VKRFSSLISAPVKAAAAEVYLEVTNNREVKIEGLKRILKYEKNSIRIAVKNMSILFCGRNLSIKCLTADSLIVEGFITGIEFLY
jgi:sporulation protein YqfC